jgi:hypothetical protein
MVLMAVAVLAATACTTVSPAPSGIRLSRPPQTVGRTNDFNVGEHYTIGHMTIPTSVKRPVSVMAVDILHYRGIEVLGVSAFEPDDESIGLVPGWPPAGYEERDFRDPLAGGVQWSAEVDLIVGIRTREPRSGLRGLRVRWIDGDGVVGEHTSDLAVLTCAPRTCDDGDTDEALLMELGLMEQAILRPHFVMRVESELMGCSSELS